ncbi:MAG TPA: phosphatase PAP2 family protein [Hypericibacter adhaerens]|jgi:acid phosphatase (class A)|uniref:Acid phosphatase n=1 Tax=Hypericibacter adhaerens TaxID=2602016 RepID=A0A5J6N140_9PROT|nr:phosphatase PAP2 family protein [Hypericibacter adhaerens]QEX23391.1 acid phosphatase [Hypericibacter adhaerens]HWA45445.1 phosphatase PAP2 family protein [Hypericibacter adhaerens]HWA81067.1 phosphatase PAP2 family protein [Acetobacteraceae bacterium]
MVRKLAFLLLVAFVQVGTATAPAWSDDAKPFVTAHELDLTKFLPPPAALDTPEMKNELAEILTLQVTRTPEMVARAQADAEENVWRFADVLGPRFVKETLPKTDAFFARIAETEGAVVDPAKDFWKRPRPHLYSDLVKPVVPLSKSGAYPSGHATLGTLMAIMLSNMVPEKRAELMARGWDYANNRVVGGIHFRSDVVAGRIAGNLIAEAVMNQPDFAAEFDAARAELRAALGLPQS